MKLLNRFVASKAPRVALIAAALAAPTVAAGADQLRFPDANAGTKLNPPVTASGTLTTPLFASAQKGSGVGIQSVSKAGDALLGASTAGNGVYGLTSAGAPNYKAGVYGRGLNGSTGVEASSDTGVAVFAHTDKSGISLDVFAPPAGKGFPLYVYDSTGKNSLMYLDTSGNLWIAGVVTQYARGHSSVDSVTRLRHQLRRDEDRIARDERELSDLKQAVTRLLAKEARH